MNWSSVFYFFGTDAPLQAFIFTILAVGVYLTYRILDVADLSVEGLFPFAAIITLLLINSNVDPFSSMLIAVLASAAIGALNAFLHIYLKVPSLLCGIIIMIALYSVNVVLSKGNISVNDGQNTIMSYMNMLFKNNIASKMVVSFIIMLLVLLLVYWFFGTELGLSLRAAGKNKRMARANGLNTSFYYFLGMIISSSLIGLAGSLYSQATTHISSEDGKGIVVIGLAIVFLGEVIFGKRSFKLTLVSLFVGSLIYWLIMDIISVIPGFDSRYLFAVQALFITIVVSLPHLKGKFKGKFKQRKETITNDRAN